MSVPSGLVLVDKPAGLTSHDVVARIRRLAGTRKVGHAGTLDPMATGVLVVGIEKATRLLTHIVGADKTYLATIRLGAATVTDDAEGEIVQTVGADGITEAAVMPLVAGLTGQIQQVPSAVSAIKVDGKRSCARVRAGEDFELSARPVTVHEFSVLEQRSDFFVHENRAVRVRDVDVMVRCSSGTYVRALARDLGAALGCGGHLTALRRTAVGPYDVSRTRTLEQLATDVNILPIADAARALLPVRDLTDSETRDVLCGRSIRATAPPEPEVSDPVAAFDPTGRLLALLRQVEGHMRPLIVMRHAQDPG